MSYAEALYASIDAGIISRWVEARQEEHLHLDFKQATARPKDDRINFAIALSAFANADGGIIVWGVKTERASGVDVAAGVSPITPLSQFVASLNDFTGQAVNPLVDGVVHKVIETDKPDTGFVVTLIPSSDSGPHMAKLGEDRYYKRSGSRFAKMEHYEVADMFGRRQRPLLNLNYRVSKIAQTLIRGAVISQSTTITLS